MVWTGVLNSIISSSWCTSCCINSNSHKAYLQDYYSPLGHERTSYSTVTKSCQYPVCCNQDKYGDISIAFQWLVHKLRKQRRALPCTVVFCRLITTCSKLYKSELWTIELPSMHTNTIVCYVSFKSWWMWQEKDRYKRYNEGEGLRPFEPCREGRTPPRAPPCVCFSAGDAPKKCEFFSQSLLYVSGDFHTFRPFPERIVLFQVSGTIMTLKVSSTIKGLKIQ